MNNQKLVTLTLTRGQVSKLLDFLPVMEVDFSIPQIEDLRSSIETQLELFDYNKLCHEISLRSYLPYVKLINDYCSVISVSPTRFIMLNYRFDAFALLRTWTFLPHSISMYLSGKIHRSALSALRRLRHCKKFH